MKGQNYVQKIRKKKEANLLSVRIMHQLLHLQKNQPSYDFEKPGWNPVISEATNPFAEETEEEADLYSELPEINSASAQPEKEEGRS